MNPLLVLVVAAVFQWGNINAAARKTGPRLRLGGTELIGSAIESNRLEFYGGMRGIHTLILLESHLLIVIVCMNLQVSHLPNRLSRNCGFNHLFSRGFSIPRLLTHKATEGAVFS